LIARQVFYECAVKPEDEFRFFLPPPNVKRILRSPTTVPNLVKILQEIQSSMAQEHTYMLGICPSMHNKIGSKIPFSTPPKMKCIFRSLTVVPNLMKICQRSWSPEQWPQKSLYLA
jgi:hypothetical protein